MVPLSARAKQLSLTQKVALLTGSGYFTLRACPEVGLGEIRLSDGPTGVRGVESGHLAALLPNATLLASTWDEGLLHEVGRILAEEAVAQRVHVVLGPTINLHRTPLGGRLFEMYSEDPLLTGRLAAAYVRGLQDQGVAACLKHFVANESETERTTVSSVVDERTLREAYLLPFEIAIADAHPWSVMAAYNRVNGTPATEHNVLINDVLRGEWGWDGVVISDWGATTSVAPAANGGLDLVMPGPAGPWGEALVTAVEQGLVDGQVVDQHVERLLLLAERVGALDEPRSWPAVPGPASVLRRTQLSDLATAGMTVLTNNGVLPLASGSSVALIGRHAVATVAMGGGSAEVRAPHEVTIEQGLCRRLGDLLSVQDGVEVRTRLLPASPDSVRDPETGEQGLRLLLHDRHGALVKQATTTATKDLHFGELASVTLSAEIVRDGEIEIGVIGVGRWRVSVDGVEEVFELTSSGKGLGEEALAPPSRAVTTRACRGSRVTAVADLTSAFEGRPAFGTWGLAAGPVPASDEALIARAEGAAAASDVAVVVIGLTEEQETESTDKATLALPGRQDELVRRVAAVAPLTVVVVNAATPVLMPWKDDVAAILWAGLPGQEGGDAVAAALLGEAEPAGRLVTTFPAEDGAAPAWGVDPVDGEVVYAEGPFVGYRGHAAGLAPAPLFWFGHGLGYGSWHYDECRPASESSLLVRITNTGSHASREVVQVYLAPREPGQPVRLCGWASTTVQPGGSCEVTVVLDPRAMRRWGDGGWVSVGPGELLVARGLGDVRLRCPWPLRADRDA